MISAEDVGRWLHQTILENGARRTAQSRVVRQIRADFGEKFSYKNKNGNWAIDREVLKEFNKVRDEHIVWDRSNQTWRVLDDDQLARLREREARRAALRAERNARRDAIKRDPEQDE